MKSLLVGTGRYLCKVYNYHDSHAYGYDGLGSSFDWMVWYEMVGMILVLIMWIGVIHSNPLLDHILRFNST
jgi:hypothetical protein